MEQGRAALRVVPPRGIHSESVDEPPDIEAAFRRYSPYVAAISLRLVGRDDEVDDVVQDVFLSAVKGLHRLRDPRAVKGWLATVTVRVVRRRLRKRRLMTWVGLDDRGPVGEPIAPGATPEQRALLSRVYAVLDHMPANQRIAWVLRHIEGEKLEDVARLAGCSLATAKRRISAAQSTIEEALSDG